MLKREKKRSVKGKKRHGQPSPKEIGFTEGSSHEVRFRQEKSKRHKRKKLSRQIVGEKEGKFMEGKKERVRVAQHICSIIVCR